MAGLYLHIPFCKQACTYCDFHFSTSIGQRERVMEAMRSELRTRAGEARDGALGSIYLGGGTPSIAGAKQLEALFSGIHKWFLVDPAAEVTIAK